MTETTYLYIRFTPYEILEIHRRVGKSIIARITCMSSSAYRSVVIRLFLFIMHYVKMM